MGSMLMKHRAYVPQPNWSYQRRQLRRGLSRPLEVTIPEFYTPEIEAKTAELIQKWFHL
jgi:hypothetical protein